MLEAMEGIGDVLLVKVQAIAELVGIICVIVDGVVAPGEVNLNVGKHILNTRKGKLQGMISGGPELQGPGPGFGSRVSGCGAG